MVDVPTGSEVSFDEACRVAFAEAAKTLRAITLFRTSEAECMVRHDKTIASRVTGNTRRKNRCTGRTEPFGAQQVTVRQPPEPFCRAVRSTFTRWDRGFAVSQPCPLTRR
jgi:flavin-binding protein dodecin